MKVYSQKDVGKNILRKSRIAIIGYGSQGRAQALNLKDCGLDVVVGVRPKGPSAKAARKDGLEVATPQAAAESADVIALLVPDLAQKEVYDSIVSQLQVGATLVFAHGFNIHFGQIIPRVDLHVVLIAPKGPGDLVRREFQHGRGVPCLIAIGQDPSRTARKKALAFAHGIGGTRGGVILTTFAEETETDLFGEQVVLCGGMTNLVTKGFETLVEAGYQPEIAYYEVLHELKLMVDLLHEGGLSKMHRFISETAKFGDLTRGPRIVNSASKREMRAILSEIQEGKFAAQWLKENAKGRKTYRKLLRADLTHPIEKVGAKLRARMPWLEKSARS